MMVLEQHYERGLKVLKERAQNASWLTDVLTLEARLHENLSQAQRYGDTETRRAERAQIVEALNALALQHLGVSLNDLCLPAELPVSRRPPVPVDQPWSGGVEITVLGKAYLLHDPVDETWAPDRSFVRRRAKAWQPETDRLVWLKQVRVRRPTPSAIQARDALSYEGRLLTQLEQRLDFPRLFDLDANNEAVTIVYTFTPGPTLVQVFGPLGKPLDAERACRLLRSMRSLCSMLGTLHRKELSHRYLTPEDIVMLHRQRDHAVLRDLGLAALPRMPEEGPTIYRAPEQARASLTLPGPHTDVYQLSAVLYHLLTGRPPSSFLMEMERPSALNRSLPSELDAALLRALSEAPDDRWPGIGAFCSALKQAADRLQSHLRGNP